MLDLAGNLENRFSHVAAHITNSLLNKIDNSHILYDSVVEEGGYQY